MALSHFVIFEPPLKIDTSGDWSMMQLGMIVGFFTAWPVNRWLVRSGVKEKMDHRKQLALMVEQVREERSQGSERDEAVTRERRAIDERKRSRVSS